MDIFSITFIRTCTQKAINGVNEHAVKETYEKEAHDRNQVSKVRMKALRNLTGDKREEPTGGCRN